jgi:hypothetical protein
VGLAYVKDITTDSPKVERDLRSILPPTVPVLASIPRLTGSEERRRAVRFAAAAISLLLVGCVLNILVFLKYHPKF